MSTPAFEVTEPGLFTTVQDRGRHGFQRIGVPVSGAMDEFALRAANLLVGNEGGAAALEMTVLGPSIRFLAPAVIAVTGADLSATLDGAPLPRWRTAYVEADSVLTFRPMRDGVRAYLAIGGGIDVPVVMGSRSTYVKSAIGGVEGRALAKGDIIPALLSDGDGLTGPRRLPGDGEPPVYGDHHEIRVIPGPQDGAFTQAAFDTLLSAEYAIALDSDRMGYRLEGPTLEHTAGADIVSDGNPPGSIQVPGDGVPMVLLADRGTTGGYAKIATVISTDLSTLAQALPGHTLSFRSVGLEKAHQALREAGAILDGIAGTEGMPPGTRTVTVDGEAFEAVDQAGDHVSRPGVGADAPVELRQRVRATVDGHSHEFDVEVRRQD